MTRSLLAGVLSAAVLATLIPAASAPASAAPNGRAIASACPALDLSVSPFRDVAGTHVPGVACVARWGVTRGTSASRFSPHTPVTRGQVGSFLARVMDTTGGSLPPTAERAFADTRGSVHRDPVDRLAAVGVLNGVGVRTFAPQAAVRRDQMASMLVRAFEHRAGRAMPTGGSPFPDIAGSVHATNIRKAAAAGLTSGTSGGTYDPAGDVSRQQMATFVSRLLAAFVEDLGVRAPDDGSTAPYFVDDFRRDGAFLVTNGELSRSSAGSLTSSPILRVTTRRQDFADVRVTLDFQHRGFVTGPRTPARDWDGLNVWIRHRDQYHLYYGTLNRRDGRIALKKKEPRPNDPASNYGEYFTLAVGTLPFRSGADQRMSVEAKDLANGNVRLRIRDARGRVVLEAVDDGTVGGPPIRGPGAVGVRGDNSHVLLQRLEVSPS